MQGHYTNAQKVIVPVVTSFNLKRVAEKLGKRIIDEELREFIDQGDEALFVPLLFEFGVAYISFLVFFDPDTVEAEFLETHPIHSTFKREARMKFHGYLICR